MKSLPLTEVKMLGPFVGFLEERGAPVNRILDRTNLSREMVDRGHGKVTKLQFYQFLKAGGPNVGLPDFGYRIGERHGMRFIGPVGRSVLQAATLKDGIDTFAAHLRGWLDGNHLWLEQDGHMAWLCNRADDGLQKFQGISNQCALMTLVSLVREVAGSDWTPKKIRLDVNTGAAHGNIEALAEAQVETIPHGIAVRFPAEFLNRPILCHEGNASKTSPPPASSINFTATFEKTLRDQLPFIGVPTIPQAAEIAGTSPRTLQRLLGADGLTYRRLLDRIRFQMARERFREDPDLTTRELAAELHFASPSSFVRSFHRIAGMTPGAFAKRGSG
jgi:AraC-like DNA-binding protein